MERGIRFDKSYETMPWHRCDSVVFDIGNVLIYFAPDNFIARLFPGDEQKQRDMMEQVYRGKYWPRFDRGDLEYEEAARLLHEEYGHSEADYLHALTGWIELKEPIEEGWRAVRRCKRAGMRLYLLSNYPRRGYERMREKFADLFSAFDGGVISCYVHQLKPEREIFETLIGRCGLEPARTLFIDDTEKNVDAALELGINGFHNRGPGAMDGFFV